MQMHFVLWMQTSQRKEAHREDEWMNGQNKWTKEWRAIFTNQKSSQLLLHALVFVWMTRTHCRSIIRLWKINCLSMQSSKLFVVFLLLLVLFMSCILRRPYGQQCPDSTNYGIHYIYINSNKINAFTVKTQIIHHLLLHLDDSNFLNVAAALVAVNWQQWHQTVQNHANSRISDLIRWTFREQKFNNKMHSINFNSEILLIECACILWSDLNFKMQRAGYGSQSYILRIIVTLLWYSSNCGENCVDARISSACWIHWNFTMTYNDVFYWSIVFSIPKSIFNSVNL